MSHTSRKAPHKKRSGRGAVLKDLVRKGLWLDPDAMARAQTLLGTTTERETVETALDMVAFRSDLAASARALRGMRLRRLD